MLIKIALSRLCYMQYTAFYLPSDKQFLSPHTTGKKGGNDVTFDSLSHTSCAKIHCYLDFKAIVS